MSRRTPGIARKFLFFPLVNLCIEITGVTILVRFRSPSPSYILLFCNRVRSITDYKRCNNTNTETQYVHSVHSATLGKGKSDDTLIKIRKGDLTGKGEVAMVFGKQAS